GFAVARRHRVHGHALARHFARQGHGEAVHAGLGGRVVGLAELAGLAVDRTDVDDAAETARHHTFDRVPAQVEHAVEVDRHHRVPLRALHLAQGGVAGDAGGV